MVDMNTRRYIISTRDMVFTALFAAVLCAVAPFSIPIGLVPLSLATLVIYIAAGTLDWRFAVVSTFLYVMLGAVGVPVFSNFEGGFHKIAGVTGGFIIGYIPCSLAASFVFTVFRKKLGAYVCGMIIGTLLLYSCGTAWFLLQTGSPLPTALALCVTPFLPGDAMKIILACFIAPQMRKALARSGR